MIKINKTLGLALLTALAASCSSDNDVAQSNNPTIGNGESAFATLRINLPTQQGTRVANYDDGLNSEYAVNDGTLLVFKKVKDGDTEGAYQYVTSVDLGNLNPWFNFGETGVQTTANITAELGNTSYDDLSKGNIYGLVILNNGTGDAKKITLPSLNETFSDWNKTTVSSDKMTVTSNGIVMANAPEWKESGKAPLTLVPIDGSMVKPTAALAEAAGVAANIYVERGLAKVTMDGSKKSFKPTGSTYNKDLVLIKGWVLDVTNKSSFPVHNVDDLATDYAAIWTSDGTESTKDNSPSVRRFVDGKDGVVFRRVYWGKDPNYSKAITDAKTEFNLATTADLENDAAKAFGDDNPKYCLENTFDIDHMKQNQTTRVLFKAIYRPNNEKLIFEPDKETKGDTFYKIGDQSGLYTEASLKTLITNIVKNVAKKADGTGKVEGTDYTLDLGVIATKAGDHKLTDANFKAVTSPAKSFTRGSESSEDGTSTTTLNGALTKTEIDNVNAQLNGQIKTYLDGFCYYIGRIKHFGQDETPWSQGDPTYGTGDDANLKYLGRYGVLRNNWYDLSVNSISGPGEPTVPDTPDTPDDDNYNYINLSVKVLKWAKRGQELHF